METLLEFSSQWLITSIPQGHQEWSLKRCLVTLDSILFYKKIGFIFITIIVIRHCVLLRTLGMSISVRLLSEDGWVRRTAGCAS